MHGKHLFFMTAALASLPLLSCSGLPGIGIRGNGKVVGIERPVSAFFRIDSGGSTEVRVRKGPAARVVVTTDENLQEYFVADVSGGMLNLGYKPGSMVTHVTKLVVDVYLPELEGVTISGSGNLTLVDSFKGDAFKASVSGSGTITGTVRYDSADVRISGSGIIKLAGSCGDLELAVSGSGDFSGSELSTQTGTVTLSGSGDAELAVARTLDIRISGSGSVKYHGRPVVNSRISGSGLVRSIGD